MLWRNIYPRGRRYFSLVFERVVDVPVRISVVHGDPPDQFPLDVLHRVVERRGRFRPVLRGCVETNTSKILNAVGY